MTTDQGDFGMQSIYFGLSWVSNIPCLRSPWIAMLILCKPNFEKYRAAVHLRYQYTHVNLTSAYRKLPVI